MITGCRKLSNFYFRILAVCLAIFPILKMEAYALDNNYGVISPYWQADSSSYTFIAVTHPSLSWMASQIGLTINAMDNNSTAFNTAASFTIAAGTTQRVFIVRTGHTVINSTIIPSATFIVGTTNYTYGNIFIEPIATDPREISTAGDGGGYRDVTMLSFFGGIVFDSANTGFAMEFIGDTHDSSDTFDNDYTVSGVN